MPEHPDITRLRAEYAVRAQIEKHEKRYSLFNPAQLFFIQQRQRQLLKCLNLNGFQSLSKARILEIGCGGGGVLLECLSAGALSTQLHGTDLLLDRIQSAHQMLGNLPLTSADGQKLPYATHSFDLAIQFTVFSSILDDEIKTNLARELLRVTRPTGLIIWYDFWLNPANPQTRGIRPAEIRRLFPKCLLRFHKITLAPPITRRLAPFAWGLCLFLESLKIFNTHYLVEIKPDPTSPEVVMKKENE